MVELLEERLGGAGIVPGGKGTGVFCGQGCGGATIGGDTKCGITKGTGERDDKGRFGSKGNVTEA